MRFLPVAFLGLASVAVAELSSWNDVVGDVPQCMKTCLNDFYDNSGIKDQCGSANEATVNCLCGVKNSMSAVRDSADDLSSCIQGGCDTSDLTNASTQLQGFLDRFTDLENQCSEKDSTSGASSAISGFNTMLASGVVLLIGVAL